MKRRIVLTAVLLISVFYRFYSLSSMPSVVNGDETGSVIHSWQILLGQLGPFDLTHDGSVPALVYYPKALVIAFLGIDNSLFAVRTVTAIFSLLTLIIFYFIVSEEIAFLPAVLITFMLSSSYWLLNFSRISWVAVDNVFFGLLFYFLLKKNLFQEKIILAIFTGLIGALVFIGYMGGKIYLLSGFVFLLINLSRANRRKILTPGLIIFILLLSVSPFIFTIFHNLEFYLIRAKTLSIFNLPFPYYGINPGDSVSILKHQLEFVFRGFVVFDKKVSNEGIENLRLLPLGAPCVNVLVQILFYTGIVIAFAKKKGHFFIMVYLLNIFLLQIPSVLIPSWSRALGTLPAIYYFAGFSLNELFLLFRGRTKFRAYLLSFLTVISVTAFSFGDWQIYFNWVNSKVFKEAQEPSIKTDELSRWQKAQYQRIKNTGMSFTIYEWRQKETEFPETIF